MAKVDKIVITNFAALTRKYKASGVAQIQGALKRLIAADKARGIATDVADISDVAVMGGLGVDAVAKATNPRQNKIAVDAVYRALSPHYVMLLGAIDVIPHQNIVNLLYQDSAYDDDDRFAFSDLPYACEAGPSRNLARFVGPTRVVGRLPDITRGKDAAYLVKLIDTAASWRAATRREMSNYFAVSARTWMRSTRLTTSQIFGNADDVMVSPHDAPPWTPGQLQQPMHFFNCHGSKGSSYFVGEATAQNPPTLYPTALVAADLEGAVRPGVVVAAECCYGGQLYALSRKYPKLSICNTYFGNGAYGMFASTTIAYGLPVANSSADLICQYFMSNVLKGASLGRAALEARQQFVRNASPLDPVDRKTLAQFNLYGDPSITPVRLASATSALHPATLDFVEPSPEGERVERADRRRGLLTAGVALAAAEPRLRARDAGGPVAAQLRDLAGRQGLRRGKSMSFDIERRSPRLRAAAELFAEDAPAAFHVVVAHQPSPETEGAAGAGAESQFRPKRIVVFVGKEVNGELVSVSERHSR